MMKIIQHTPTQLVLRHRPIALRALGSFLTIIGVVIIILFSKTSIFTCERVQSQQGSCELKHSYFLMSQTIIISTNDLKSTEVVMTRTRGMSSFFTLQPHYQVILLTPTEKIPLTLYGTVSRDKQETMAAQINTFINNPDDTSLIIDIEPRWLIYLLGGIFIIIGLLAELSKIITVTFDKVVGGLKIEWQGLLGNEIIEHSFDKIIAVKLNTSSHFNSKTLLYQIVLQLKSGENILLTSNSSTGKARKQKIVDEITNFLAKTHDFK